MKRFLSGLKILLLYLTIAIGAIWIGYQLYRAVGPMTLEAGMERAIQRGLDSLPSPAGDRIRVRMQELTPVLRDRLIQFRTERQALLALLKADTPDEKAIEAGFARIRALANETQETYQKAALEVLMELTPEERRAVIAALEKHCKGDSC